MMQTQGFDAFVTVGVGAIGTTLATIASYKDAALDQAAAAVLAYTAGSACARV